MPAFFKTSQMTIAGMLRKVRTVNLPQLTGDVIASNTDKMADVQRAQLMRGEDNKGQLLPSILNDPYFTSPEKAKNYADWKKRLFPDSPYGIPNLIVTGVLHGSIVVKREGDNVVTDATASFAKDVSNKYGNTELGLNTRSREQAYWSVIRPQLIRKVSSIIGGVVK